MTSRTRLVATTIALSISTMSVAFAQERDRVYVGTLFGVSTLSADGRSVTAAPNASVSVYKPENGIALNVFAGAHLTPFVTVQANYVGNRNDVALVSAFLTPTGGGFYEQVRGSSQHAIIGDVLVYFRALGNGVRPYLSTGVGLVRFESGGARRSVESGLTAPQGEIAASSAGLRVAVGIDIALGPWALRYSFSETIGSNPVSDRLTPRGERNLANFQNLFGFVRHF